VCNLVAILLILIGLALPVGVVITLIILLNK
jgi:hypothetical protein